MTKVKEYFELIEGIQLNRKDKDVKKINKNKWEITHENRKYIFRVKKIMNIYNVYWYLEGPNGEEYIELPEELKNKKLMMQVFNKVLTAFYQFLATVKPINFVFTADKKIARIYIAMLQRMQYEEPFKWYLSREVEEKDNIFHYYFSRKSGLMPESRWKRLVKMLEN